MNELTEYQVKTQEYLRIHSEIRKLWRLHRSDKVAHSLDALQIKADSLAEELDKMDRKIFPE